MINGVGKSVGNRSRMKIEGPIKVWIKHMYNMYRLLTIVEMRKDVKSHILQTYLRTFVLKQYNRRQMVARICQHRIKFVGFTALSILFEEIFMRQDYHFVSDKLNPFIIDCGSNIGMSVIYFKVLYPYAEILAFEPGDVAFRYLTENVRDNRLTNVALYNKALLDREGEVPFYYDAERPTSLTMSTVKRRMPRARKTVQAGLLSTYVEREVDFLKMDVEGAEYLVIEELMKKGRLKYIRQMVIEYHHHIIRDEDVFSQMIRILEDAGFGYQIESQFKRPLKGLGFQDILVYAYRKK